MISLLFQMPSRYHFRAGSPTAYPKLKPSTWLTQPCCTSFIILVLTLNSYRGMANWPFSRLVMGQIVHRDNSTGFELIHGGIIHWPSYNSLTFQMALTLYKGVSSIDIPIVNWPLTFLLSIDICIVDPKLLHKFQYSGFGMKLIQGYRRLTVV